MVPLASLDESEVVLLWQVTQAKTVKAADGAQTKTEIALRQFPIASLLDIVALVVSGQEDTGGAGAWLGHQLLHVTPAAKKAKA